MQLTEKQAFRALKRLAEKRGYSVDLIYGDPKLIPRGSINKKRKEIKIDCRYNQSMRVWSLAHEIGHSFFPPSTMLNFARVFASTNWLAAKCVVEEEIQSWNIARDLLKKIEYHSEGFEEFQEECVKSYREMYKEGLPCWGYSVCFV